MNFVLRNILFTLITLFFSCHISAQNNLKSRARIIFKSTDFQQYGFDAFQFQEWKNKYDTLEQAYLSNYLVSYKSVGYNQTDEVDAVFQNKRTIFKDSIEFLIDGRPERIRFIQKDDSTFTVFLPKKKYNYSISAQYKNVKFGQLNVLVYAEETVKVTLVPLLDINTDKDILINELNNIYRQANVSFNLTIQSVFKPKSYIEGTLFDNPSPTNDRYTNQMRELRNAYFDTYPNADKSAYYIFIVPGFVDSKQKGYMVTNKAVAFVKFVPDLNFGISIARQLGHGMGILADSWRDGGPPKGSTDNLMDNKQGVKLLKWQWEDIRYSCHSFSYFDNYEDVRTNNGIVAYYFWTEDSLGNIILDDLDILSAIRRPYKKNFMSYHLDIRDVFFKTLFTIKDQLICAWHILALVFVIISTFLLQRRFHRFLKEKLKRISLIKFISRIGFFLVACGFYILFFILINQGYERFEVRSGLLKDLQNLSTEEAIKKIMVNQNDQHKAENDLLSEVLINRDSTWALKKLKKVMYFEVKQDENKQWNKLKYQGNSDSLILVKHNFREKAESHYMVVNYIDEKNNYINQKVYNHLGIELTDKLLLEDPAKRLLVFVNGYRPTSSGHSFEDNFKDIQKHGLEYPNSGNMIYNFDRYDYWRPWQEIDLLFQKRINPSDTYYADGHFSVTTSNHQTLLNFTKISSIYPKRCKNKNKHTCYTTQVNSSGFFSSNTKKTVELHRTKPNKKGFNERRENGRIAGRNLLQLFNELPNKSLNDTIYIVAHSMGYAYSLGIIDELRGRINFGGFYILAPENASAGKVNLKEWKEVWQYGSNFNTNKNDAPCLLDGVAPQIMAGGLTPNNRSYIPDYLFKQKGFFDSHFVGYYTWIFNIETGNIGSISQH
jgi:hypothetical protein